MKRQRLNKVQPTCETRKRVEIHVIAHNTRLREKVKFMNCVVLLAHCHPLDRTHHAREFFNEGLITKDEASNYFKVYSNE